MTDTTQQTPAPWGSRAGRRCSICWHPDRLDLEDSLATGTVSFRAISRRFDVSTDAIRRHLANHVSPAVGESVLAANGQKAATFAARLMAIADSARDSRLEAEEREDPRIALAAARMEAEVLTNLMARLGVGSDGVARELEEARDVFAAIRDAASEHPELWELLAPAMERKSYFLTATNMRRAALTARERLANAAENAPALEGADTDVSENEKG